MLEEMLMMDEVCQIARKSDSLLTQIGAIPEQAPCLPGRQNTSWDGFTLIPVIVCK